MSVVDTKRSEASEVTIIAKRVSVIGLSQPKTEAELYYFCKPKADSIAHESDGFTSFVTVNEFLADEPACKKLWSLIDSQFNTRSKFLAIWRCVSFIAVHRKADDSVDGFLLVSAPVNWQIDYVVVDPGSRGQGIATKLVKETVAQAAKHAVPYVMLTSKPSLQTMYEACGFEVVHQTA
jgi:ribosomal protein S18 acetylase RimI-like enzyme